MFLKNCTPLFFLTFSYTADTLATLPDSHTEPVKPLSSSLAVTLLFCGRVHTDSLRIAHIHFHSLSLSACDEIFALNRKKEDQIRPCKMTVDFEDCLKDSPRFRANIDEVETEVVEIEAKLDKLVKLCSGMIEAGKVYVSANKLFVNGIRDLSQQCKKEEMISECLEKCSESLQEIVNYHMILFDQAQRSVKQQLHNFVKEDVRKFKETKKHFDKVREDLEIAQVKNAQAPRNKPHEVEEATCSLNVTRKCYRHLALDYVLQINVLQAKKKFEILDAMLSFMHAQYSLFQQGFKLLDEIDPYMKKLAAELDQLVIDSAMEKRDMEHKHATIQQRTLLQDFAYDDPKVEFDVDAPNGVVMEGYLFKRASNAFKTWNRRWFSIQNSQLVYQKKLKDSLTVVVEDLRLCSVKPCEDIERRFCFEVVSPSKSCMLQAESEKLRQAWIQAVQASIASAYRESPDSYYTERLDRTASPSTSSIDSASEPRERSVRVESVLQRVQCVPGNDVCCDCGQADPRWASINLGILLCIECSGIHRSLGVHCSKVRSLTLDSWEPELLKLMCELGNSVINHIYEGMCEEQGLKKPGANSPRQEKEMWIRAKYVEKKFLKKMAAAEALVSSERKSERRWAAKKCRRHNSATTVPKHRRKYRQDPGSGSLCSAASALERKFRRDSLFCPDELDSLFSYFDTSSGPRSLSSDSGLGGSSDGSTDVLLFGSVVDSVTEEECEVSEDSSGEVELEPEASDPEDVRELHPGALLYKACQARNLPVMAEALAHGADVNSINEEDEGKSPLMQAVIGGSLIACEFLLQNGADVNQRDLKGRGPLHHATYLGHTGQVCLFLKRGATQNDGDDDGQDPLSIAVQAANADIVTLLRLARMNEEMREAEGPLGQPGQYPSSSPTEQQYKKCIQEFICLNIAEC
ncbi:arf-GAP with coiled-coil, ANK repeat and PH domain-containing protein 3 isoform X2 [Ictalurus furcatus]|uniref:arf-GAP with coiled-coil, ANK repeat and PH domain-containing protein 3 isoform X2 n=1 Tax=Ictalurus furcatus TaxID=66913 RepID=UPI0023505DEB|nr:arf-GAP with coiled-coil, ANK repeat and PH domain-containing protein 3 isoform X2 [Ictalurus furcatus]